MRVDRNGMRMLSRGEALARLATTEVGRVGVTMRAMPVILPVTFVLDRENVVFRTGRGTKLAAALNRHVVAFQADDIDPGTRRGWSVLVIGTALPVEDEEELAWVRSLPLEPWIDGELDHFVRIPAVHVSGRELVGTEATERAPAAVTESTPVKVTNSSATVASCSGIVNATWDPVLAAHVMQLRAGLIWPPSP